MKKLIKTVIILLIIIFIFNILDLNIIKNKFLIKIYRTDYYEYVDKYAKQYDVDPYLIFAIIKAESNFNEYAISNKGAQGLMQLMYSTAEEIANKSNIDINEQNILQPDININIGTKYISMLIQKYQNINLALAAYNAGSGNVDNWINDGILLKDGSNIENIPFVETNQYVRKILRDYKIYQQIYK